MLYVDDRNPGNTLYSITWKETTDNYTFRFDVSGGTGASQETHYAYFVKQVW